MLSQNFKVVAQLQAELHLLKIEKLDACIRPLFANSVTYVKHICIHTSYVLYHSPTRIDQILVDQLSVGQPTEHQMLISANYTQPNQQSKITGIAIISYFKYVKLYVYVYQIMLPLTKLH